MTRAQKRLDGATEATRPLDGVLVADFSRVLAGPLAAVTLADLGATVIKVERPATGDDTRAWGPPWTDNSSSYFESANRSKLSIELDLDDPTDVHLAHELARRADVMIENFLDGALDRRGLGHDQVQEQNPSVIYCSITGFGSHGGAAHPGYDFLVQAVGGLMSITGAPDGEPTKVGVALVDVLTSKDAVIGILAALRAREVTGVGQRVEVNLLSSLLGSLANQATAFLTTKETPGRMGNQHPSIAPYETLRCKDDLLAVCCGNDRQFRLLAAVIEAEALADDDRFRDNASRVRNRRALAQVLEEHLSRDTADTWAQRLNAVGVSAGKIGTVAEGFALAESLGLEPTVAVGSQSRQVRHPVTYSATPVTHYAPPPRLGQHSDEIRRWLEQENR